MTNPTAAPTVPITFDGELRTLKYGFRAYDALGLNPFDPESVKAFSEKPLTVQLAAQLVRAGMLHEYTKRGPRFGQEPPTVDEVLDVLDFPQFVTMFLDIQKAMGTDEEAPADQPEAPSENPPVAQA